MTLTRTRVAIFGIFLGCLLLQLIAIVYAFLKGRIYSDELSDLILVLLQIYSVHLAIVIGSIFGGFVGRKSKSTEPPIGNLWTAILLVCVWNILLVWRSLLFGFIGAGTVTDLSDYFKLVSTYSTWLIAGCIAFFFSKR